jgi:curved DNA-binding protein
VSSVARDYYETLGVSRTATPEELQRAYRTLARRHHPDVNKDPQAQDRFKEINEAYQVLKDPQTRRRYDRFGPDFRQVPEGYEQTVGAGFGHRGAGGGGPGGAGGGPGGTRTGGSPFGGAWDAHDSGIDLDDLFGGLFGARGASGPIPGADQQAELTLTVQEAYDGGRRLVTLAGADGPRRYEVDIPAGITEGQRIRLAGQGARGRGDAPAGDLYLVVHIAPDDRYQLRGRDLVVDLPLAPWEAALGATIPVLTPGGVGRIRVPAGSSTGRRLRLRGRGMPNPNGPPGDLYAQLRVVVPGGLSDRERQLFTELAAVSTFDAREASR